MGPVIINGENGGMVAHKVSAPNHKEIGVVDYGRDVGDTGGVGNAESRRDTVGGHLNWPHTEDGGLVGSATPNIKSLRKKEGLRRGGGGGVRTD